MESILREAAGFHLDLNSRQHPHIKHKAGLIFQVFFIKNIQNTFKKNT